MLRKHDYPGKVLLINPRHETLFGERTYPTILDAPGSIDHAFIMVPADAVSRAIEECVERHVTVATIYSDGFAEVGLEGWRKQERIVQIARAGDLRLLGPNCSGVFSTVPPCALSVNAALEHLEITPGPLAVISQSGSMTGGLVSRGLGRGASFSHIVSIGNEADIGIGELVDLLIDDAQTGAILLFIESIRDAPRLSQAARRAAKFGKPIIAYKLGRSEVGREIAASHTGAMVGSDKVTDAFFRANGILRVDILETLFELPTLLIGQSPSLRHRVAVMSTTGGGAALVVDRLGTVGVDVVAPSDEVVTNLAANGISISKARLTDLTHAGTKAEVYGPVLDELLGSDHCDLVVAVAGSSAQFQPELAVEPVITADRKGKPLAMFIAPHAEASLERLSESGVAGFRTPESCVDAIRAWTQWVVPSDEEPPHEVRLAKVCERIAATKTGSLNERESSELFTELGIPFAPSAVIGGPGECVSLTFPVVAKVLSVDIPHKSDAGAVVLGINDAASLWTAAQSILDRVHSSRPTARIEGLLVQQMESGLVEVILGFRRDQQVGPVVVLGVGGVLAEIYQDYSVRMAPVSLIEARSMVDDVRGLTILTGFRGLPVGDITALCEAIVAMSQLAFTDVVEAEINPLLVRQEGQGVVGVDALVVLPKPQE